LESEGTTTSGGRRERERRGCAILIQGKHTADEAAWEKKEKSGRTVFPERGNRRGVKRKSMTNSLHPGGTDDTERPSSCGGKDAAEGPRRKGTSFHGRDGGIGVPILTFEKAHLSNVIKVPRERRGRGCLVE